MSEIVNKVAQSKLVTFDLEAYYPAGRRLELDIRDWLFEGLLLREKDFRASAAAHDWQQYADAFVALHCSSGAIVPAWAFMLITTYLQPHARRVFLGGTEALETALYQDALNDVDVNAFRDKPIIIKGCSKKPVPPAAYLMAVQKLLPVARSIFYGEACSSVPLFKRK
jgi:hypothetical protein